MVSFGEKTTDLKPAGFFVLLQSFTLGNGANDCVSCVEAGLKGFACLLYFAKRFSWLDSSLCKIQARQIIVKASSKSF